MKSIEDCIQSHIPIATKSLDVITSKFHHKYLKKSEFLLKSGSLCREMAFIKFGYLRMYDIADGKEITLWIGSAGNFITSVSSFVFQTANPWNIQAVTDCELLIINRDDHMELLKTEKAWLEFDNILLARSYELLENNMFSHLHTTAHQRFQILFQQNPALFNHVPLQYIASMLGITPETLSRLRNKA